MTLKIRFLRCSRRLFIILVSLTVTLFSEKMLIYARCIRGFMSNSIIKSWKDSNIQWTIPQVYKVKCSRLWPWHLRCLIHFVSPVYCEFSYFNSCLVDSGYFHLVNQYFITAVINHMTFYDLNWPKIKLLVHYLDPSCALGHILKSWKCIFQHLTRFDTF